MIRAEFDWLVAWQIKKLSAVLFCFSFLYIRDFKKTKGVVLPWDNDDKLWFICSSVVLRFTMGLCYINQSGERWWRKYCDRRVYTCSCKMIFKPGWKLRVKRTDLNRFPFEFICTSIMSNPFSMLLKSKLGYYSLFVIDRIFSGKLFLSGAH